MVSLIQLVRQGSREAAKKNKAQSRKIKRAPKKAARTSATSKAANDWINALG
jgi:hypothetical protein